MSRSYYHRRHRKIWKVPPWGFNLFCQRPMRRETKRQLGLYVTGQSEDVYIDERRPRYRGYWL